jgi:hypothetical protein
MVDELGAEEGFRGELLDFLGVLRVVAEGARARLGEPGCRKTQRQEYTEQAADHIAPRGDVIAEDYINGLARKHNQNIGVVDDAGPFGL